MALRPRYTNTPDLVITELELGCSLFGIRCVSITLLFTVFRRLRLCLTTRFWSERVSICHSLLVWIMECAASVGDGVRRMNNGPLETESMMTQACFIIRYMCLWDFNAGFSIWRMFPLDI